jgi:membrane protease YdiL (CAAX protease family)
MNGFAATRATKSRALPPGYAVGILLGAAAMEWLWPTRALAFFPGGHAGAILPTVTIRVIDLAWITLFLRSAGGELQTVRLERARAFNGLQVGLRWCLLLGVFAATGLLVHKFVIGSLPRPFSPLHRAWFVLPWPGGAYLAVTAVLSPLVEELIFRGILYNSLRTRFSVPTAILLSAPIFAAAHGSDWTRFAPALAGALVFSLAFERARSLWAPLVIHSAGNTVLWLYGRLLT